jgi:thioredoxin reductase (NADPH)
MKESDVIIIGAGPVGLFAVHQCGMLGLSCQVIDALPEIGGQCTALYPEKPIYDIPAYPEILAGQLIEQLEHQATPFRPLYHLGHPVIAIQRIEDFWHVQTEGLTGAKARSLIIAAGAGAFGPNRPPLENIAQYEGTSVFYMVRNKEMFRDRRVVIAGGGDSAVDWALALKDIAKEIHVIHRRDKFRAAPESVRQLHALREKGEVSLHIPFQLASLEGESGQLQSVRIKNTNGETKELAADILLPFFGLATSLGPIAEWGLGVERNTVTVEPGTQATNISGIYAIGDVASYPHKLKLILTGFAEAAQAAHAIRSYLYPDQEFHFEYSTTKGIPKL